MTLENASDQIRVAWIIVALREFLRKYHPNLTHSGEWEAKVHGSTLFRTRDALTDTKISFYNLGVLSKYSFNLIRLKGANEVVFVPLYYGALCHSGRTNFLSPKRFVFPPVVLTLAEADVPFESTYGSFSQPVLFGMFLFVGCSNPSTPTSVDVIGTFIDPVNSNNEFKVVIPHALSSVTRKNLAYASDPEVFKEDIKLSSSRAERVLISDDEVVNQFEVELNNPIAGDVEVLLSDKSSIVDSVDSTSNSSTNSDPKFLVSHTESVETIKPTRDGNTYDRLKDDQVTISTLDKSQIQTSEQDMSDFAGSGSSHSYHPFIEDLPCVYRVNGKAIRPGLMQGMVTVSNGTNAINDNIMRSMLASNYMIFTLISRYGTDSAAAVLAKFSHEGVIDLTEEYIHYCLSEIDSKSIYSLTVNDIEWLSKNGCIIFATVTAYALEMRLHWTAKWLLFVSMAENVLHRINYDNENDRDISFYPDRYRAYSSQAEMYVYDTHLINELAVARVDITYLNSSTLLPTKNYAIVRLPDNSGAPDSRHFVVINRSRTIVYDSWYLKGSGDSRGKRSFTTPIPDPNGSYLYYPHLTYSRGVNLMLLGKSTWRARDIIDIISKRTFFYDSDLKKNLVTVNSSDPMFKTSFASNLAFRLPNVENPFKHWIPEEFWSNFFRRALSNLKLKWFLAKNYNDLLALMDGTVKPSQIIQAYRDGLGSDIVERPGRQQYRINAFSGNTTTRLLEESRVQTLYTQDYGAYVSTQNDYSSYSKSFGTNNNDFSTSSAGSLDASDFPNSSW